ncbi:hypothetical protein L0N33_18765, partial [Roseburia faecis]|nr:hypothetical protein [Roseburia faecis]
MSYCNQHNIRDKFCCRSPDLILVILGFTDNWKGLCCLQRRVINQQSFMVRQLFGQSDMAKILFSTNWAG